jgi:hypothetical protein
MRKIVQLRNCATIVALPNGRILRIACPLSKLSRPTPIRSAVTVYELEKGG